jgi:hypothetical protein
MDIDEHPMDVDEIPIGENELYRWMKTKNRRTKMKINLN